jgi:hypothetical protein
MRQSRRTAAEQVPREPMVTTTTDRRLRDRCQAVLMASRSRQCKTIAQALGGIAPRVPLAHAVSGAWRGGLTEPRGPRPTRADARDVGAARPGRGARWSAGLRPRSSALDLGRAGNPPGAAYGQCEHAPCPAGLLAAPGSTLFSADVSLSARQPGAAAGSTGRTSRMHKKVHEGDGVLLRQEEARGPLGPA